MTSAQNRPTTTLSRRDARALATRRPAPARVSSPAPARLSRRRGVLNVFAGVAAFGFLAAYLVPTTAALAEGAPVSAYETATADAQAYVASADFAPAGSLQYGTYAVELAADESGKPHPKATLEVWQEYAASIGVDVPEGATRDEIRELVAEKEAADAAAEAEAEEAAASQAQPAAASAGTTWQTPFYTGGGAPADWMAAAGIAQSDWGYVDYIVSRESGWNPNATNPYSGACGLVQALPCSKVPGGGYDPVANLTWANGYAVGRYGSWANAYAFWTANHWW
ncbi:MULTISPECIES: lytic transglycosylase domain-containing protein [unclassified Microbacterium]|uniref:lytic transglycosylase domain-containing protein n=1 Tax=unclassified Microbacterium TaxID=2609290 RepID=UPI001E295E73|nr:MULTISPECIES: lytic transglycosylase domain-containing protein [unclassified Microbacterium]